MEDIYDEYEKRAREKWQKSKDRLYAVVINFGGGLWPDVYDVRHTDEDEKGVYWTEDGNTSHGDGDTEGCKTVAFKRKKDAENFLAGAKFFRDFMIQFFQEIL
jgi:hypothetical protein